MSSISSPRDGAAKPRSKNSAGADSPGTFALEVDSLSSASSCAAAARRAGRFSAGAASIAAADGCEQDFSASDNAVGAFAGAVHLEVPLQSDIVLLADLPGVGALTG